MNKIQDSKAVAYAKWCIIEDSNKVPKYVKLQCEQWLAIVDGKVEGAEVNDKRFNKICKLLKVLQHPDLQGASLYTTLENYQWLLITALLCTYKRDTKLYYYNTAVLEIARKNYKTFCAAVIFLLVMLLSPKMSRFFSVAPDLKLSKELQEAIRKIIKATPALVDSAIFKLLRSEVRCTVTDTTYTPLAYSNDKLDGKLATLWLADESGAMGIYPIEAMRSSQINMVSKLGIIISTKYPLADSGFNTEVDIAKNVLEGGVKSAYFSLLYEPDEAIQKDWQTNNNVIYQSNPVAVDSETLYTSLVEAREMAILYPAKRENYLCKHNNIMYRGVGAEEYVDNIKLQQCSQAEDIDFWHNKNVYLGLDLSQTTDNTALSMLYVDFSDAYKPLIYCKVWCFIPSARVAVKTAAENIDYTAAIARGECFATGDEVIDYRFVEEFILDLQKRYGVHIQAVAYDRCNAISTAEKLNDAGLDCIEYRQYHTVLGEATKLLKESILSGTYHYDSNKLLEINYGNAKVYYSATMQPYVEKKRSTGKVDMVVATINALQCAVDANRADDTFSYVRL